jgi:hypothetical protein
MKYFFGVSSKNQVDSIIKFSLEHPEIEITFIPSRRQIEYNGGYVNDWNTKSFSEYVKFLNPIIKIERDHSGPGQGLYDDNGYESLEEDCKYFDLIHIDPWKKYSDLNEGIKWTIDMINFCHILNPNIEYEIGTEEAIRPFTVEELEKIIIAVKSNLPENVYNKIKYCVIQCGNSLKNGENSGLFDKEKLSHMLELVDRYNFISKEHNGDWVHINVIKQKQQIGLKCINIAPEFGEIESRVILNKLKNNLEDYNKVYDICINSGKWKKWVSSDFDYINKKDEIILISCHYIFNYDEFKEIKNKFLNIDEEIHETIKNKLLLLYFIFEIRDNCIFCNNSDLKIIFENNYSSSLSLGLYKDPKNESYFMPYNVQKCLNCNSFQNKYIGDLSIIYDVNHIDNFGQTKTKKHTNFCNFIIENKEINSIIEIGSCNGVLANCILENVKIEYNIVEPSFTGDKTNLNIITDYFENIDLNKINSNTIIMSDVFEHFYNPVEILNKLKNSKHIKYIYLNHPDFDYSIKNDIYINLNCEHTFLIEHHFLFTLFENYGFKLNRRVDYENFSLFLEFEKVNDNSLLKKIQNNITFCNDVSKYFNKIINIIKNMNSYMNNNSNKKFYIWPTSIHSIPLFTLGLNYKNLSGVLDNSPNKIGKYLYGYKLLCSSLDELLKSDEENICVFIGGAGNYIKELELKNTKIEIIFANEL